MKIYILLAFLFLNFQPIHLLAMEEDIGSSSGQSSGEGTSSSNSEQMSENIALFSALTLIWHAYSPSFLNSWKLDWPIGYLLNFKYSIALLVDTLKKGLGLTTQKKGFSFSCKTNITIGTPKFSYSWSKRVTDYDDIESLSYEKLHTFKSKFISILEQNINDAHAKINQFEKSHLYSWHAKVRQLAYKMGWKRFTTIPRWIGNLKPVDLSVIQSDPSTWATQVQNYLKQFQYNGIRSFYFPKKPIPEATNFEKLSKDAENIVYASKDEDGWGLEDPELATFQFMLHMGMAAYEINYMDSLIKKSNLNSQHISDLTKKAVEWATDNVKKATQELDNIKEMLNNNLQQICSKK